MGFPIYFLHDPQLEDNVSHQVCLSISEVMCSKVKEQIFRPGIAGFPAGSTVFVMIPDEAFAPWLPVIKDSEITIVVLPYQGNPNQQRLFSVPRNMDDAITLAAAEGGQAIQSFIQCEGSPTLGYVTIGDTEWIEHPSIGRSLASIFSLHLKAMQITAARGWNIETASMLMEIGHEALMNRERSYFFRASHNQCRQIAMVIYAPQSILQALKLRLILAHKKRQEAEKLPPGIGTIKSASLVIHSPDAKPMAVSCNGRKFESEQITVERVAMKSRVLLGEPVCMGGEEKEMFRVQNLPIDPDMIRFFSRKKLPFIPIASENSFAELFTRLRDSASLSHSYLVLLLVSVFMAAIGLFQNSSPTIIGAMILAPLMAPIIAFAMGAIRFDERLLRKSSLTVIVSVAMALAASALVAKTLPFSHVTDQMATRMQPNLLDLAVAIFAGLAAAYGYANSKVGESLAGVAIAVALIPPLCVSGIGIGWGSWTMFSNAFLLFMANIVGIVLASGAMFFFMGYASSRYASTAFIIKLLMVAIIAAPLFVSTRTLITDEHIYRQLSSIKTIEVSGKTVQLHLMRVMHKKNGIYAEIGIGVRGKYLDEKDKKSIARNIKQQLAGKVSGEVDLIFHYWEVY